MWGRVVLLTRLRLHKLLESCFADLCHRRYVSNDGATFCLSFGRSSGRLYQALCNFHIDSPKSLEERLARSTLRYSFIVCLHMHLHIGYHHLFLHSSLGVVLPLQGTCPELVEGFHRYKSTWSIYIPIYGRRVIVVTSSGFKPSTSQTFDFDFRIQLRPSNRLAIRRFDIYITTKDVKSALQITFLGDYSALPSSIDYTFPIFPLKTGLTFCGN